MMCILVGKWFIPMVKASLTHTYIEKERERHVNVYIHIICTCVMYIYIYMHTCNIPTFMWVLHPDDFRLATSIFWKS